MKRMNRKNWVVILGAGAFASLALLPQAKGELVYENPATGDSEEAAFEARPETADRETLRQALSASQKSQATRAVQPVVVHPQMQIIQQPMPAVQPTAVVSASMGVQQEVAPAEVQNFSKTELMRRERVREEVKNEDILQERLEELRLRDEKRRTEQLMGITPGLNAQAAAAPAPVAPVPAPAVQDQIVVTPITERPGQPAVSPQVVAVPVAQAQPVMVQDQMVVSTSAPMAANASMATGYVGSDEEKTQVYVQPRGGMSNLSKNTGYSIDGKYSAGIGLGVSVSDNLSFELGYSYSEYGVALNSATALGLQAMLNPYGLNGQNQNSTGALKQNVYEAGLKLHFLGPNAKLRPFIGGGAGYAKSYLNYDQRILDVMRRSGQAGLQDYDLSQFLGTVSAGFDIRLSKSISVGAIFKYYTVLSSRQNLDLNNQALYGYYPGAAVYSPYGGYNAYADADKQYVGGSLADVSFYSILAGVSFVF